jgi:hypothetical protein
MIWLQVSNQDSRRQYSDQKRLLILTVLLIELIHIPRQVLKAPQENLIRDSTLALSSSAE